MSIVASRGTRWSAAGRGRGGESSLSAAEIEEAIFAHVVDGVSDPVGVGDVDYMAGLRATISAVVEYGLVGIDLGEGLSEPVPSAAIMQARHAVRLGVSLETVLCRYIAGYKLLVRLVTREAEDISSERGVLADVLSQQASLLERLVSAVTSVYLSEVECLGPSPELRRAELVQRLLDGGTVDASYLGYDFDAWHIGVIATGAGALRALRVLAADRGQRLLVVQRSDDVVWARRVQEIEQRLDRRLSTCRAELEVALRLGDLDNTS